MITLTQDDMQLARCTFVPDDQLMTKLATTLGTNAEEKRVELTMGAIEQHIGETPSAKDIERYFNERCEDGKHIWVCWRDDALAIRTEPRSRVVPAQTEDALPIYELGWIWRNINDRN